MATGSRPRNLKPTYCPVCECNTFHPPDIGCVVCAARAAKPGPYKDVPEEEPTFQLSPERNRIRKKLRKQDVGRKRSVTGSYYGGVAPLIVNAIRRDRRRRIYPKH